MLPVETISAVFPPSAELNGVRYAAGLFPVRVSVRLRPITLLHAVGMEALGVSLDRYEIPAFQALTAAWVMTLTPDEVADAIAHDRTDRMLDWAGRITEPPEEIARKVSSAINVAFSTCVPGKQEGPTKVTNMTGPTGYGWPLEVADVLAAEYSMTIDQALATPIVRAFAMLACARIRNGGTAAGPDYYERIVCRKIHERKERERRAADVQERVDEEEERNGGE